MDILKDFLNYTIRFSDEISISVKGIFIVIAALILTAYILRIVRKFVTRQMNVENRYRFVSVFSYVKWVLFVIIFLVTLDAMHVKVTAILVAASALLIGVGLALQTFFQDIITGILILIDNTVKIDDIIEIEGKVGRVTEIKLRTTRAVTIDNKVLIIPNHLYLTNSLYNWTQNGKITRESVEVGVAYGSDVQLVKKLLIKAADTHPETLKQPETTVLFTDFGDNSLNFKVIFTLKDSFMATFPKSDIRFKIDKLFREHNISIPFPQRDVHIIQSKED